MEARGPHLFAHVEQHHDDLLPQPSVGWSEAQQQVDDHLEACVVGPNKLSSLALPCFMGCVCVCVVVP
jgi:hypothetical protein